MLGMRADNLCGKGEISPRRRKPCAQKQWEKQQEQDK